MVTELVNMLKAIESTNFIKNTKCFVWDSSETWKYFLDTLRKNKLIFPKVMCFNK